MDNNVINNVIIICIHAPTAALPQITGQSGLVTILENSPNPTVLSYTTTGIPPPHSYQWLRNGFPFQGNNRVRVTVGHSSSLEVRSPSRNDSGSYTLVATSLAGRGTLTVELQIACKYQCCKSAYVSVTTIYPRALRITDKELPSAYRR